VSVSTVPGPLLVALGIVDVLVRGALTRVLPWSNRSQHEAWKQGYMEGLAENVRRASRTP